jgi:hypothetical protein
MMSVSMLCCSSCEVSRLYDELFPHFSSSLAHVGLDETFDLGMGMCFCLWF